jgi:uncharacterized protein YgiM (DUF1202 family)
MRMLTLIICLTIASLACGMQAVPTVTPVNTDVPQLNITETVPTATHNAQRYYVTAPLNVRAEANADSQILGTLEVGTEVDIFVLDIRGDDCFGGEWYAIEYPIAGNICSLYLEELK